MEHLASRRHLWYTISLIVIVPGLLSLIFFGLNRGIDFTGGTLWELKFDKSVQTEQIKSLLANRGFTDTVVQLSSDGGTNNVALIRMKELEQGSQTKKDLEQDFKNNIGSYTELQISSVGASVGNQIQKRAIYAVMIASVGILLYIAYAFRNTQNPALYGICAIVAMLHDVLVVLGIFSILGKVAGIQIDALF